MNVLKLSFLLILVFLFIACRDNEANDCTPSDWLGIYEGSQDCDGETETVTVTIIASGSDAISILLMTSSSQSQFIPLTPIGCSIDKRISAGGDTFIIKSTLDDDKIILIDEVIDETNTTTCTLSATRK